MPLNAKLLIGLTLLFTILMGSLFAERMHSTRQYAQEQLSSTAQDAASSLAYPLSKAISRNDPVLAETAIKVLVDRGYYNQISVVSAQKAIISQVVKPNRANSTVPTWFIRQFPLEVTPGEALISDGWRQLGRVIVESDPNLAYEQVWRSFIHMAWLLGGIYIATLGLMIVLVQGLLRPLRDIEHSTKLVQNREFHTITSIPGTREFKRVVLAFNIMIERVKAFLAVEQERAEEYRKEAFIDPVTQLENRRSLDLRIESILKNTPPKSVNVAVALQCVNLSEINTLEGYQAGDKVIAAFAAMMNALTSTHKTHIISRLNGTTLLAIIEPDIQFEMSHFHEEVAAHLRSGLSGLTRLIRYSAAIVEYRSGVTKSKLLSEIDLALQQANYGGGDYIHSSQNIEQNDDHPRGAGEWRDVIRNALTFNSWQIKAQDVHLLSSASIYHREITASLNTQDGQSIKAALFVPMAARQNLLAEVESSILETIANFLRAKAHSTSEHFAINIGLLGAISNSDGLAAFLERLATIKDAAHLIALEIPEHQLLAKPELALKLVNAVKTHGYKFGIDHFGFSAHAATMLQSLRPDYVKIDRRLINDILEHSDSRKMLLSLMHVADSLNILTIAQGVETEEQLQLLRSMQFKGVQGYLIGKPSDLT